MKFFMELLFSLSFSEWMLMIQTTIMIIECRIRIIEYKRKTPSSVTKITGVYLSTASLR